jgi:ubiquinone/menaquinone biosynthesis C-methylase UbiE
MGMAYDRWLPLLVKMNSVGHGPCNEQEVKEVMGRPEFQGKKLLDIGAGNGTLTKIMAKMGFDVTGIDFSPLPGTDTIQADAHDLPFPVGRFDVVLSTNSFEHVASPFVALCEMNRVLVKEGIAVIIMPESKENWMEKEEHVMVYNELQMKWLAKKCGFAFAQPEYKGELVVYCMQKERDLL